MAFSSNGNNLTRPTVLGRPGMIPGQTTNFTTNRSFPTSTSAPNQSANTLRSFSSNINSSTDPNQQRINSILGNNALTPQQKQQQIQAAGLGNMPIIYGGGSAPGAISGGAPPPPNYTPTFSAQINKLFGADPLNLLGGSNGVTGVANMSQAMDQINRHRAALGSNFINNNSMGASGTFSPVITGQNFQSQASPLASLFNYLNVLGSSGANRSNNYSS